MTDEYANVFDFAGLKPYTPSGLSVIAADNSHLFLERKTTARTMLFIVRKEDGEFFLHARNRSFGDFGLSLCDESNQVLRADRIGKILAALGYSKTRVRQVAEQLTLSRPPTYKPSGSPRS